MRYWIVAVAAGVLLTIMASVAQAESKQSVNPVYTIAVSFSDFTVHVYDFAGNELFCSRVALPRFPIKLPVKGRLVGIEREPWWYPPPGVKAYVLHTEGRVLPDSIPPGPENPLGPVKFLFAFSTPGAEPLSRMHGTNHPKSIGRRATSGCIRLSNHAALALADLIEPLFDSGAEIRVLYTATVKGERIAVAGR